MGEAYLLFFYSVGPFLCFCLCREVKKASRLPSLTCPSCMFAHDAVSSQQRRYIHSVVARRLTGVSMKREEFFLFLLGKQWEITTGNTRVTGNKWEPACWRTSACVGRPRKRPATVTVGPVSALIGSIWQWNHSTYSVELFNKI